MVVGGKAGRNNIYNCIEIIKLDDLQYRCIFIFKLTSVSLTRSQALRRSNVELCKKRDEMNDRSEESKKYYITDCIYLPI